MFTRKSSRATIGLCLTLILVTLAACAPAATPEVVEKEVVQTVVVEKAAPKEKVHVDVWYQSVPERQMPFIQEILIDDFNQAQDDIEAKWSFIAEYGTVMKTALAAGAAGDIVFGDVHHLNLYFHSDLVRDLDEFSAQYGWQDIMVPFAYMSGNSEGHLFCVQQTIETMMAYYNKSMFDERGWQVPKTLEDYEELCPEILKAKLVALAQCASWWLATEMYTNWSGGMNLYQALKGDKPWTDPEFVGAVNWLKDWNDRRWFSDGKLIASTTDGAQSLFISQKAAMIWKGTWQLTPLLREDEPVEFEWDWEAIPGLSEYQTVPTFACGSGGAWAITTASRYPDAAGEVLAWFYSDRKRAARMAASAPGEFIAPLRFTQDDWPPNTDPRLIRAVVTVLEAIDQNNYGYLLWAAWPPGMPEVMVKNMQRVVMGEITSEEGHEEIQKVFEENIENVPPLPPRE